MTKIVRENYPVSKLPEELRQGLAPGDTVRVTIDSDGLQSGVASLGHAGNDRDINAATVLSQEEAIKWDKRFGQLRRQNYETIDDVVAYVRSLRE